MPLWRGGPPGRWRPRAAEGSTSRASTNSTRLGGGLESGAEATPKPWRRPAALLRSAPRARATSPRSRGRPPGGAGSPTNRRRCAAATGSGWAFRWPAECSPAETAPGPGRSRPRSAGRGKRSRLPRSSQPARRTRGAARLSPDRAPAPQSAAGRLRPKPEKQLALYGDQSLEMEVGVLAHDLFRFGVCAAAAVSSLSNAALQYRRCCDSQLSTGSSA